MSARFMGLSGLLVAIVLAPACSKDVQAVSPQQLEREYGIVDARAGQIATSDGTLRGTLIPVTLRDGTKAELVIPDRRSDEPHRLYLRDDAGIHPVELQENVTREQLAATPAVVTRRPERPHPRQRSWEKDVVIIGGSAGAGALVGGLTGGKKGAGIGAGAGGLGGLIYDLATRKKG